MTRCQECGYSNEPGASVCKKCGSALQDAAGTPSPSHHLPQGSAGGTPTMIGGASAAPPADNGGGRVSHPTVVGNRSNMPAWDDNTTTPPTPSAPTAASAATGNVAKCPSCGFYPLRNEVSAASPCPNCGNTGGASASQPSQPAEQPAASHQMQKAAGANKTIRLGDLTPAEEEKPEFKLVDERSQNAKEFTGAEVSVNRDNLDAGNMSISGQEHAKFVFEDGKWYLSDQSSNGATFIQVKGKVELEEDAKILIGNKIYTFKSK